LQPRGGQLVGEEGNVTVKSDAVREALAWFQKIVPSLPPSVFAWDNAANNKWLISGQGALINESARRLGRWPCATHQTSLSNCGLSTRRADRKAASIRAISAFGVSGISRPTNLWQKVFWPTFRRGPRSKNSLPGAAASTFRPLRSYATSRPGRRKNRPRVTLYNYPPRRCDSLPCRLSGAGGHRDADDHPGYDLHGSQPTHRWRAESAANLSLEHGQAGGRGL